MMRVAPHGRSLSSENRFSAALLVLFLWTSWPSRLVIADEFPSAASADPVIRSGSQNRPLIGDLRLDLSGLTKSVLSSRVELTPRARVSRSHGPLRRVTLVGGDRFDVDRFVWEKGFASFHLMNGTAIRVPSDTLAALTNPPGELDVLDESFEGGLPVDDPLASVPVPDQSQSADGGSSIRIDSNSADYRQSLPQSLTAARIEFLFKTGVNDPSGECGEWQLEWSDDKISQPPLTVHIGSHRDISTLGVPGGIHSTSQLVSVNERWHTFIAIVTPERTRLIIDEAILASFSSPPGGIRSIRFQAGRADSKNVVWIDSLHVRSLRDAKGVDRRSKDFIDDDVVFLAGGDELFGRLLSVTRESVSVDSFEEHRLLKWQQLEGVAWRQPRKPVQQMTQPSTGVISLVEMQPFVDRPASTPEQWTGTVLKSDSETLVVQHPLVGELTVRWSDIRRVESQFYGQMFLIDARRIHLGNSIRPDFRRHLPDGTEFEVDFRLTEIPRGRAYLSLEASELEAAAPNTPPASPFLAQLRAGQLVTEAVINDRRIGPLNSQVRFKANSQNPDRIRLAIPEGVLKIGENKLRLRQQPLKYPGREFDDCELGNFRLEFDLTEHD